MEERIERIVNFLSEKKAENIESVDLRGKGYIVDSVIIATALNNKHSIALLNYLRETLKPLGEEFVRVEEDGEWSIIDMGDMLIHIMTETHREKYNIEDFLKDVKRGTL
ncbi:MAG: ribosome silencing factor [Epsilonproteobacteria bacterium]|nr:ribosome silencing factor [Campylobacterota bacterium]